MAPPRCAASRVTVSRRKRIGIGLLASLCALAVSALGAEAPKLYPWKSGDLWGFVDSQGKWAIAPRFAEVKAFQSDGLAEARAVADRVADPQQRAAKLGLIDSKGEWALEPMWDGLRHPGAQAIPVESRKSWSLVTFKGKDIGRLGLKDLGSFSEGLALAWTGGLFGYVDEKGEWVVKPKLEGGGRFSGGLAPAKIHGAWGYIDSTGTFKIAAAYAKAGEFSQGLARVKVDGEWGLIRPDGSIAAPISFDEIDQASEGFWPYRSGKLWGFLDSNGRIVIQPRFEKSSSFRSALARERDAKTGLWGYINGKGEWAIRPAYEKAEDFSAGLSRVRRPGSSWLLLDATGREIEVAAYGREG
jgi:hypothetical protein